MGYIPDTSNITKAYLKAIKEVERLEKQNQKLKDELKESNKRKKWLTTRNKNLNTTVKEKDFEIEELKKTLDKKDEEIVHLKQKEASSESYIQVLEEMIYIENLEQKLSKLQQSQSLDCSNSSIPTGRDIDTPNVEKKAKSVNTYNNREKTHKKVGGQKGHKGSTLREAKFLDLLNQTDVNHTIEDLGDKNLAYTSQFIIEVSLNIELKEIRKHKDYKEKERGSHHLSNKSKVIYGPKLKALCVLLNTKYSLSHKSIQEIISNITGEKISLSTGSIHNFIKEYALKSKPIYKELEEILLKDPIIMTDSTVMVTGDKRNYIRIYCNKDHTLYEAFNSKSIEALEESFIKNYSGLLVHDHEVALYRFGSKHSECLVHLLRYLNKTCDETKNSWAFEFRDMIKELIHKRKVYLSQGQESFNQEEYIEYNKHYDALIDRGYEENNSIKIECYREDEKALLNRLTEYKDNHLFFMTNFNIEPDNNRSERGLRICKNKQKISGGFRKFDGLDTYSINLTSINALLSKDKNILVSMSELLKNN